MGKFEIIGHLTNERIPQLNIDTLVRNGYVAEGRRNSGTYQAQDSDPEIEIYSDLATERKFIQLSYKSIFTGNLIECELDIVTVPSNLGDGRGVNLYFGSPDGVRAKILYYNFWNDLYVHRKAYPQRILYPLQVCTKADLPFERAAIVERKLLKELLRYKRYRYRGELNNIHKRIEKLMKQEHAIRLLKDERHMKLYRKYINGKR